MSLRLPGFAQRLINALPDLRDEPWERQLFAALFVSIALHILALIALFTLQKGLLDSWLAKLMLTLPRPEAPIEIVIQPLPPPPVSVIVPLDQLPEKERVDSTGLREASAPTKSNFYSDRDLAAGSKERPTGSAPVPTVDGRANSAIKAFVKQEARTGSMEELPAKGNQNVARMAAKNPNSKVANIPKKTASKAQGGGEITRLEDFPEIEGELVFRKMSSGPSSYAKFAEGKSPTLKNDQIQETPDELFQEGKEPAKVKGGLADNGKVGVNASRSAMGVYMKAVSRAIGARWNELVKIHMDSLETGSVKVRFKVAADGSLGAVVIEHSTANRKFSDLCLQAVRAATLDAPPSEAAPRMREGWLEIPFTFSLY